MFYWITQMFLVPGLLLAGYKRIKVDRCVVLAPQEQIVIIQRGFDLLRELDAEIFRELTSKKRYCFWYHKSRYLLGQRYSTITDNFLLWGPEGAVACFVQFVMDSASRKGLFTRQQVQMRVFDWLEKKAIRSDLTEHYRKF